MKTSQMLNAHHEMRLDQMNDDDDDDDDGGGDRRVLKKIQNSNIQMTLERLEIR